MKIVANKKSEKGASFIPSSAPTSNIVQELPKQDDVSAVCGKCHRLFKNKQGLSIHQRSCLKGTSYLKYDRFNLGNNNKDKFYDTTRKVLPSSQPLDTDYRPSAIRNICDTIQLSPAVTIVEQGERNDVNHLQNTNSLIDDTLYFTEANDPVDLAFAKQNDIGTIPSCTVQVSPATTLEQDERNNVDHCQNTNSLNDGTFSFTDPVDIAMQNDIGISTPTEYTIHTDGGLQEPPPPQCYCCEHEHNYPTRLDTCRNTK